MATDFGIKVFKEGVDTTSNTPSNFFMNSEKVLLKIHKQGRFKTTAVFGDSTVTVNFEDLGYRPFVLVYAQRWDLDSETVDTDYHLLDWSYFGATQSGEQYVKVYNNKIEIKYLEQDPDIPRFVTLNGYYYIFKEEVKY